VVWGGGGGGGGGGGRPPPPPPGASGELWGADAAPRNKPEPKNRRICWWL